jgi:hypothetical protein
MHCIAVTGLSSNDLVGRGPQFPLQHLPYFNVTFNHMTGHVPDTEPSEGSYLHNWVSIPAILLGMVPGFGLLSSFLLPFALNSGEKECVKKTVPRRKGRMDCFSLRKKQFTQPNERTINIPVQLRGSLC